MAKTALRGRTAPARPAREPIVGTSPHAEWLRRAVKNLAAASDNVLLTGEAGCGKGFLARRLHEESFRSPRGMFIEITPQTREEALGVILFDEERRKYEGILGRSLPHMARRTTLLIRNIHEFGFLAQTRIARFLIQNERMASPPGEAVRVVVALPGLWEQIVTERPMNESLADYCRRFAEVAVLPLRHRREDVPAFVDHFLKSMTGGHPPAVSPEVLGELRNLPYYENVRELRLLLADALRISREGSLVLPDILRDEPAALRMLLMNILGERKTDLEGAMRALEKALVRRALLRCDLDRTRAAGLLGLTDINLRYRLKKFGLIYPLPSDGDRPRARRKSARNRR